MRRLLSLLLLIAAPAYAQPNHRAVVEQVFATGQYNLQTHEGQGAFVDAVAVALHAHDARWGHLKKNPGQTQLHGHAEDAALYLSDSPGQSIAVDFIVGAGGPSPRVGWNPDSPRYSRSDWYPPSEHAGSPAPPPPPATVDLTQVLAKLDALSHQLAAVSLQVASVSDRAESARVVAQDARNRIEDVVIAVDLARQQINRPPLYVGRLLGVNVTLRPSIHPANAIP
jgi:hypothetical protein